LTSAGIAPKNGWIADYPVTPDIIGELRNAVGEAADSGKIAMKREEAIKAFQDLMTSMESQSAGAEPPIGGQPYPEPYYDPYYYPYPYYYGGYYYPYLYPYFSGGFAIRGFRGGGRGGGSHGRGGHGGGSHGGGHR